MASMDDWIPLPMAVRRPVVRLRIASATRSRSAVGASMTAANAAERHEADPRACRLALDERDGGLLRRLEPGGLDVGGAHAPRDVHREDHRRLVAGHRRGPRWAAPARRPAPPTAAATSATGRWRRHAAAATGRRPGSATGSSSAPPPGDGGGVTTRYTRAAAGRRAGARAGRPQERHGGLRHGAAARDRPRASRQPPRRARATARSPASSSSETERRDERR